MGVHLGNYTGAERSQCFSSWRPVLLLSFMVSKDELLQPAAPSKVPWLLAAPHPKHCVKSLTEAGIWIWSLKHKDFTFLRVVPNLFSPEALFFGVPVFVTALVTCRGRCSTGSLPVVRDVEENFGYMRLCISSDELGPWLKHSQAGGSCQMTPCHSIRDAGAIRGHSK